MAPSRAALTTLYRCAHPQPHNLTTTLHIHQQTRLASFVPYIAQPSLWKSLVPRFLRRSEPAQFPIDESHLSQTEKEAAAAARATEKRYRRNETRFFVIFSLIIGSQAINMLTLRRDYVEFSRETEAKLDLLREVVRRVKAGEEVDIARELGKGIEKEERAWEDVIRELEQEDEVIRDRVKRKRQREKAENPDYDEEEQPKPKLGFFAKVMGTGW